MSGTIQMTFIPMLNSGSVQGIVDTTLTGKLIGACSSMPSATTDNNGCVVLYTGASTDDYIKDHFYVSNGLIWDDLGTVCGSVLTAKSVQVSWTADASVSGYSYKGTVALTGCTADHMPIVAFSATQAASGNYCPVAESADGCVYIWGKVSTAITVDVAAVL